MVSPLSFSPFHIACVYVCTCIYHRVASSERYINDKKKKKKKTNTTTDLLRHLNSLLQSQSLHPSHHQRARLHKPARAADDRAAVGRRLRRHDGCSLVCRLLQQVGLFFLLVYSM